MTGTTMMFRTNYATVASFARNGARMFWQHVTSGVTIAGKHARTFRVAKEINLGSGYAESNTTGLVCCHRWYADGDGVSPRRKCRSSAGCRRDCAVAGADGRRRARIPTGRGRRTRPRVHHRSGPRFARAPVHATTRSSVVRMPVQTNNTSSLRCRAIPPAPVGGTRSANAHCFCKRFRAKASASRRRRTLTRACSPATIRPSRC